MAKKSNKKKVDETVKSKGRKKITPTIEDDERRRVLDRQYENLCYQRAMLKEDYLKKREVYLLAKNLFLDVKSKANAIYYERAELFPAEMNDDDKREAEIRRLKRRLERLKRSGDTVDGDDGDDDGVEVTEDVYGVGVEA